MNRFNAWATHYEDPMKEIASAMRASRTAERHVVDRAHDLQSAVVRGNKAEITAARQAFRQAWEADVRRKGGKPEDFIPGYPDYTPTPVSVFGAIDNKKSLIGVLVIAVLAFVAYKKLF